MRTMDEYNNALKLRDNGLNNSQISRELNIPRRTIIDWVSGKIKIKDRYYKNITSDQIIDTISKEKSYSYILGVYLGDGHITKMARTYRIRIFQDTKYPGLIKLHGDELSNLLDKNKICLVKNANSNCMVIVAYSCILPIIFPQHGAGRKHNRKIKLEEWQEEIIKRFPIEFISGLLYSDGCIFYSKGKLCYEFSNMSKNILEIFEWVCDLLNVKHTRTWKSVNIRKKSEVEKIAKLVPTKY